MINIDFPCIHHTFLLYNLRNTRRQQSSTAPSSVTNSLERKTFSILNSYVIDVKNQNLIKTYSCYYELLRPWQGFFWPFYVQKALHSGPIFCFHWPSWLWNNPTFNEPIILNSSLQIPPRSLIKKLNFICHYPCQSWLSARILTINGQTLTSINERLFNGKIRIWQQTFIVIRNYFSHREPEQYQLAIDNTWLIDKGRASVNANQQEGETQDGDEDTLHAVWKRPVRFYGLSWRPAQCSWRPLCEL